MVPGGLLFFTHIYYNGSVSRNGGIKLGIKFCSLSSGSDGNCQYIETGNSRILIDAGFSGKKIEGLLASIGVCPTTLDGIFVTHEHIDHSRGVGVLSRRYDLPIFANNNTWIGMNSTIGKIKDINTRVFKTDDYLDIKDITINPILVSHDALEPVGYIIFYKKTKISIITDTGWVNDNMINKIKDSNFYLMESNHDVDMLRNGYYPWSLKQRILSKHGHLSNDDAADVLGNVLSGNGETVVLGHLSQDNNRPEVAYKTVRDSIMSLGLDVDNDMCLELSFRGKATKIYTL